MPNQLQLPTDVELDKYHPSNQPFIKTEQAIKRVIVDQSVNMKPKHVQVTKMHLRGVSNTEIAQELDYALGTVSQILARNDVSDLLRSLTHLDGHLDGPSLALRKHMIWKMALDNEEDDPRISLAAHQELNRVNGVYQNDKPQINIIINEQLLPRGALD
jgi:hypothetical protein